MQFTHTPVPVRVLFGAGRARELGAEIERLGARRAMLACSAGTEARIRPTIDLLGPLCAGVFARSEAHTPEPLAEAALAEFRRLDADCIVPVGGGSTIGLGKYIAVRTAAPMIALPTTYSGSEMTPLHGVLAGGHKKTARDDKAMSKVAIYDPELSLGLPAHVTATTGMNSLAHCVEALYPQRPEPIAALYAEAGVHALYEGLPASVKRPRDLAARTRALYGAFLGGSVVTLAGIAIHHKCCHVLGGRHGIPHGESNSVMLAQAVAYNTGHAPQAMAALRRALGGDKPAQAIYDFARGMGAPVSLRELGMREGDLDAAAEETVATTPWNPRKPDVASVREMLQAAWEGRRPEV